MSLKSPAAANEELKDAKATLGALTTKLEDTNKTIVKLRKQNQAIRNKINESNDIYAEEVQKSLKKEKKKFAEIEELYQKVRGVFLEENAELEKSCSELEQELKQLNEILEKQRQMIEKAKAKNAAENTKSDEQK